MFTRSAVEIVRDATQLRHRRLEAMPSQERLLREDYQPAEYRWLLERLYGFYGPLGHALRNDVVWGPRVAARVVLLKRDLEDFGATSADLHSLSECHDLPLLDSLDRVLGCFYVIEGATLGGRVIAKQLERTFRQYAQIPVRFFSGDGEQTKDRWRQSCAVMNAETTDIDELCAAACATFDAMSGWLADPPSLESMPR